MKQMTLEEYLAAQVPANAPPGPGPETPQLQVANLSDDQREVYDEIVKWIHGESDLGGNGILTVSGLAGCGKSTLIGVLLARADHRIDSRRRIHRTRSECRKEKARRGSRGEHAEDTRTTRRSRESAR